MNHTRKLISLLLACMLLAAVGPMAYATEPTANQTGEVTITNAKAGETYDFYRIMDLSYTTDGADENFAYTVNEDFEAFFVSAGVATIPAGYANAGHVSPSAAYEYITRQMSGAAQAGTPAVEDDPETPEDESVPASDDYAPAVAPRPADFAAELAAYATENDIAPQYTAAGANASITNVVHGWYLMVPSTPTGSAIFSLSSIAPNIEVTNKSVYPTITKTVTDTDETNVTTNTAGVGDELIFTLTSSVPALAGYSDYNFKFTDNMTNLTFVAGSAAVTVGETAIDLSDENVTWTPATGHLEVNVPNMLDYEAGQAIVLTYKAVLDDDAVIGNPGNPNAATIVFSNDPNDMTSEATLPEVETRTYVCELDLAKVDKNGDDLSGSEWRLEKNVNGTWTAVNLEAGSAAVANQTAVSSAPLLSSANDPAFAWSGLDQGEYRLIETKAPDGYAQIEMPIVFTIATETDATNGLATLSFTAEHDHIYGTPTTDAAAGMITLEVKNLTEAELPGTGGAGLLAFVLAAAACLAGYAVIGTNHKKTKKGDTPVER